MLMTVLLRSPFGAKPSRNRRITLAAMNDPWLPMIAALSGQRVTTPSTWPAREVHRLDSYRSVVRSAPRPDARPPHGGQASAAKTFS
jgi:hypothetical protein